MVKLLKNFVLNASGATAIEYAIIASLIALVLIASDVMLGSKLNGTFNEVTNNLN
jgi:pilus assembly protein Flp/PilA